MYLLTYLLTYLLAYLHTYLLTPWSRVILEKLTDWQLVKKFSAFYGTRRSITAFTSARQLSLSGASSIQSMPPHATSWRCALILSYHLRLGLPSGLFPSGFPTKILYTPPLSPYALHAPPISFVPILPPEQYLVSSTDREAPHYVVFSNPLLLLSLRPKCSPQHPVLKNPQHTFLPQCERPSSTLIQNDRQNYNQQHVSTIKVICSLNTIVLGTIHYKAMNVMDAISSYIKWRYYKMY
jgi:hypothetical protein